ncbi:putative bifunctional diguanylate cyclase/phosphodiesterase [Paenibacillus sp. GCM10027627]|uniref:putative bifunctional diguanylate cyclase/phosphodiesterase n=1 Tax=unclassified Paenibacillus TaxID=185978 RepID=UPI00363E878B
MSILQQSQRNKWMAAASFTACVTLAVAGEWSQFHFVYGMSFTLTSLFVLLAVRLFGVWGGFWTSAVAFCAGVFFMNSPLLHGIFILEALFVGLLLRRYNGRLFGSDVLFWLLIGIPATYFAYRYDLQGAVIDIKPIACILALNGLFNALFAEMAYQYLPLSRWSGWSGIKRLPVTISQLLLHLSLGIVMLSFFLNMAVNGMNSFKEVSLYVERQAETTTMMVKKEWEAARDPLSSPQDEMQSRRLQYIIDRYTLDSISFSFTDRNYRVIASNQHELVGKQLNPWDNHTFKRLSTKLYFTKIKRERFQITPYTWHNERFLFQEKMPTSKGQIVISFPMKSYENFLFNKYITHFLYMIGFGLVAAFISLLINRTFAKGIQRLAVSTRNLPLKLKQNNALHLPTSSVVEIHSLIMNVKHMASSLVYLFHESQRNNERLQAQAQLLQQSEERLHRLAYYDTLTGLPNRLQFSRFFHELVTVSEKTGNLSIAVIFVDINRFKQINDTLGHAAGDRLLQYVAKRFQALTSKESDVFRLGGDEFVFMVRHQTETELARFADSVRSSFADSFLLDGMPIYLTLSIGISVYPDDGDDADTVIRNADIAMYNAKEEADGNYRFYKPSLLPLLEEKMKLENGLYKALLENQFSLYYQPKINAVSGDLCGIEALIRWTHPEFGLVPPDKFIPLAEESGFILEIDRWVFREACRQNKAWQEAGLKPISVSVNISAKHFYQGNLTDMIMAGLHDTGLDPQYVSLEITEGVFMRNIEQVIETILYLRTLGIQISIDDFGTGYSSLNQLQRLPISDVKLDRSFIKGITSDNKKSSIVRAIIELVHSMNMKVVAEGVETADESEFCKQLKCDELQGYLFSRPLPADELETMLEKSAG